MHYLTRDLKHLTVTLRDRGLLKAFSNKVIHGLTIMRKDHILAQLLAHALVNGFCVHVEVQGLLELFDVVFGNLSGGVHPACAACAS